MEYFVDEMPRDCASCKHYHMNCADGYSCSKLRKEIHPNFSEGIGYRHQDCPLQSLADYTKQVRKEVVEEIIEKFNTEVRHHFCPNPSSVDFITLSISEVEEFLDQVKGENNGRKIRI